MIMSPSFKPDYSEGTLWSLKLGEQHGNLKVFINRRDVQETSVKYNFSFKIICFDNEDVISENKVKCFKTHDYGEWVCPMSYKEIIKQKVKYLTNDCLNIQFSMWRDSSKTFNITRIIAHHEVGILKCSFNWHIKRFSSDSVTHKTIHLDSHTFLITWFPLEHHVEIILALTEQAFPPVYLKSKIFLLNSLGRKKGSNEQEHLFREKSDWKLESFLCKRDLLAEKADFLVNDILFLQCEFTISTEDNKCTILKYDFEKLPYLHIPQSCTPNTFPNHAKMERKNVLVFADTCRELCEFKALNMTRDEITQLYANRAFADVTFKVEGKTLAAHRSVLVRNSPVFTAMFDQDMLESKTGIIEVEDIDYKTMNGMLSFMYGVGIPELSYEFARSLIIAADKYEVLPLKAICSGCLKLNLCEATVCEILLISDLINDAKMKTMAVEFFKFRAKKMLSTPQWEQLASANSKLAVELLTICILLMG